MPELSGWDVLRALRQERVDIPVILLTARGEEVDRFPTTRTVDTHILRLRQKFEADTEHPRYILTVHGQGYKLASSDAA